MLLKTILFVLGLAAFGGFMNRWRGAAHKWKKYFPRPFPQLSLSIPFSAIAGIATGSWLVALLVLIATTAAFVTGHGKFMDLGHTSSDHFSHKEDERLEFIIKKLEDKLPVYWYDFLGLFVTGAAVWLPVSLATLNPFLILFGVGKSIGYAIGWKVKHGDEATEVGEIITGVLLLAPAGYLLAQLLS